MIQSTTISNCNYYTSHTKPCIPKIKQIMQIFKHFYQKKQKRRNRFRFPFKSTSLTPGGSGYSDSVLCFFRNRNRLHPQVFDRVVDVRFFLNGNVEILQRKVG